MFLDIALLKAKYEEIAPIYTAYDTALKALELHDPRPEYPEIVATDEEYNDITDELDAWLISTNALKQTISESLAEILVLEKEVKELTPPNQWVELGELEDWEEFEPTFVTQYIGIRFNGMQSNINNSALQMNKVYKIILVGGVESRPPQNAFPNK